MDRAYRQRNLAAEEWRAEIESIRRCSAQSWRTRARLFGTSVEMLRHRVRHFAVWRFIARERTRLRRAAEGSTALERAGVEALLALGS